MSKQVGGPQDGSRIDFELACLADCNMILRQQACRVHANKQHTYEVSATLQVKAWERVMRCIAAMPAAEQRKYKNAAHAIVAAA